MSSVNVGPEGIHPAPRHRFVGGRTRIVLSLFFVVVLLASITFTVIQIQGAHAQSAGGPLMSPTQLKQLKQQLKSKIHILPKVKSHALKAASAPAFNNIGTSNDTATSTANFDGGGFSYSEQILSASGISPDQAFVYDGITFTWPNMVSGTPNNYVAAGQVLPVTPVAGATTLGFLGAATGGPSTGNATITYTDNTTKTFALTMSDWTLGGGGAKPANGNAIVTAMTSRNTSTGSQNVKTYVFYANVSVDPTKTVQSVTLPTTVSPGQIHIFAVGTRAAFTNPYNNVGMTDDANPSVGNFDGPGGSSFSFQSFIGPFGTSSYLAPGLTFNYNDMDFTWPDVLGGVPNNYAAQGQTIPVSTVANAVRVGFIGSATNGPTCGAARINYTDGSTQSFQLCFSDWTLGGSQNPASFGNIPFNINLNRNIATGQQSVFTFTYYTDVRVQPSKTVKSVTLPNQSHLHIFSVGASAVEVLNNVGASFDANFQPFASFDGGNSSYSLQALQQAGMQLPNNGANGEDGTIQFNGISFDIANSQSAFPDNLALQGQVIPIAPVANATRLAFLGSSTNGAQSGTATIGYTDGSTQAFQLGFNDWCTPFPLLAGNSIAAAMPYRNLVNGTQSINNYLYYTQVALQAGKTIASIAFPSNSNMHIFSLGTGSTYFNNAGISDDTLTKNANFDTGVNSYSLQALQGAGLSAGQTVTSNGVTFTWPAGRGGELDNYVAQGQVLSGFTATSPTTLAFLGSATNGPSSGTGRITYTDGTSETFVVTLTDWCSTTLASGNSVVAAMNYRNTPSGKQTIKTSVYYSAATLQNAAGKTVQSVTLPGSANQGLLHIFAIGFK